jgi:hypothetical protein
MSLLIRIIALIVRPKPEDHPLGLNSLVSEDHLLSLNNSVSFEAKRRIQNQLLFKWLGSYFKILAECPSCKWDEFLILLPSKALNSSREKRLVQSGLLTLTDPAAILISLSHQKNVNPEIDNRRNSYRANCKTITPTNHANFGSLSNSTHGEYPYRVNSKTIILTTQTNFGSLSNSTHGEYPYRIHQTSLDPNIPLEIESLFNLKYCTRGTYHVHKLIKRSPKKNNRIHVCGVIGLNHVYKFSKGFTKSNKGIGISKYYEMESSTCLGKKISALFSQFRQSIFSINPVSVLTQVTVVILFQVSGFLCCQIS